MRGFISQKEYEKKMQDVGEHFLKQFIACIIGQTMPGEL